MLQCACQFPCAALNPGTDKHIELHGAANLKSESLVIKIRHFRSVDMTRVAQLTKKRILVR